VDVARLGTSLLVGPELTLSASHSDSYRTPGTLNPRAAYHHFSPFAVGQANRREVPHGYRTAFRKPEPIVYDLEPGL